MVCSDDGVDCTADFCSEAEQGCVNVPQDALCSDNDVCDGIETCDAVNGCQEAPSGLNCDDGVSCTVDSCDAVDGCVNAPDDSVCDNGTFCDGAEVCDPVNGCQDALAPINCNDGVLCTNDVCDEDNDQCVNTADDGICDNGAACDGVETCNQMLGCQAGTVVTCDDGITCTDDLCVEDSNAQDGYVCNNTADNNDCPEDEYCCTDCTPGGCAPVPECDTDADCDDGNDCNGIETCVDLGGLNGKVCEFGDPVVCNDGIACTTDSCDPADGQCDFTPVNALCDNGLFCDGAETCNAATGCEAGTAPTCNDSISCTNDACIEGFGCFNEPDNSQCTDNLACNGEEVCSINDGGCVNGTALDCDDGFDCTIDSCDDQAGCTNVPDNTECPCGEVCNPSADPVDGCSNTCVVAECDGSVYQCGDCQDNDGDCAIDAGVDLECFGPCDDNEEGYKGLISGQNDNCDVDCYFDGDNGGGNDGCTWSWACDPDEPQNPPLSSCTYEDVDPADGWGDEAIPPNLTCQELFESQSTQCWNPNVTDENNNVCGKYVPNGCDCFGCCAICKNDCTTSADCPGDGVCDTVTNLCVYEVYLGSQNGDSNPNNPGSCNYDEVENPTNCHPCTPVQACLNECEPELCELCFGQTELPPECTEQECPDGVQLCGQQGQDPCPTGAACITGCCIFG